jgi:cell division protein FtsZ
VLLSIAGGSDLGLFEVSAAANLIEAAAHEDANIIFGTVIDDALGDEVRVTVIAAGFDGGIMPKKASSRPEVRHPELPALRPSAVASAPAPVVNEPAPVEEPAIAPRPKPPVPADDDELDVPDFLK